MKPLVSIVMPVYNCEKYLRDTLDSVAGQTYTNFEVICVDDGSTDNSVNILEDYIKRDSRFSLIKQQNCYAGVARNNGMNRAKGKYLMFLDADDLFARKMLSSLVRLAEKENTDIILFGFYHFTNDTRHRSMMGIPYSSKKVCSPLEHKNDLFQIAQGVPWNKFYNREFVIKSGSQFQNLRSNNDVFFSKTIVTEAERILFLNKRYVNYRISNCDSLQGSYKLRSGNFSKCNLAMYHELKGRKCYETYKESFEKYVLDSYMLIFDKIRTKDDFEIVCQIVKESLDKMEINSDNVVLKNHQAQAILKKVIFGDYDSALFALYRYMQTHCVGKNSIEFRVGKKMLQSFRIKNYD